MVCVHVRMYVLLLNHSTGGRMLGVFLSCPYKVMCTAILHIHTCMYVCVCVCVYIYMNAQHIYMCIYY